MMRICSGSIYRTRNQEEMIREVTGNKLISAKLQVNGMRTMRFFLVFAFFCHLSSFIPLEAGEQISPKLKRVVDKGLRYLARTQNEKGYWGGTYGNSSGIVGLAALAFMAHGEVPGEGNYGRSLSRALEYILSQSREDGLVSAGSGSTMYNHGFATLALAEACGMSKRKDLLPKLERAVQLIIKSQNQLGGWRYTPNSQDADITVTGCQMMALRAAKNAGIDVPEEVIKKGVAYIKRCSCPDGGFGYQAGSGGSGVARTGIGVVILSLCGEHESPEVAKGVNYLRSRPYESSSYYYYALYYCSQALFQAGGKTWESWNANTVNKLISSQREDGSWSQGNYSAAYPTAMALLALEVNWQLLPIYQK